MRKILLAAYLVGDLATMAKLIFFDCYSYTWWNWVIAIPVDVFQGAIWPIYWGVLRPLMGGGC
ncbi:MAG: hypothetical protein ACJ8G1_13495 [Vitreoscilla sp.]